MSAIDDLVQRVKENRFTEEELLQEFRKLTKEERGELLEELLQEIRNDRQRMKYEDLADVDNDLKFFKDGNTVLMIIFVVLGIVYGVRVKGWFWDRYASIEWSWGYVLDSFLEASLFFFGFLLVLSSITVMIKERTLPLHREVIHLRYRLKAIEDDREL